MLKTVLKVFFLLFGIFSLSGCSVFNTTASNPVGGVLRSDDSGNTWHFKNKVSEKKNISGIDILQMAIDPIDTNRIYLGTKAKGIVFSTDKAETWSKMKFPANDVYGIGIDRFRPGTIYATGVYRKRGKVFKSVDYGKNWNEIYTEPADGTKITALSISNSNPEIVYIGTSSGAILKTVDSGNTWRKVYDAKGIISQIAFGDDLNQTIYVVVYKKKLLISKNSGATFSVAGNNDGNKIFRDAVVFSMAVDNSDNKNLYVGTNKGFLKSSDKGDHFEKINILSNFKKFAIRAIAVNPENFQEIVYGSAQAIYKSNDGGEHWSTFQIDTDKVVGNIKFNPDDVSMIYAGLRSFGKKKVLTN